MYKIAVVGDRDSILSFKAIGVEAFPAETAPEAEATLKKLAEGEYAVIFLTEQYAQPLKARLDEYAERVTPAVILIPGRGGSLGIGLANVKEAVERAVGADILGE
ncbi:MAG: V-type ATP synthase subunit F [Clostridiales bacterium]|nr:V-type ATP synthase subunit F [Clostridiales bacterium]